MPQRRDLDLQCQFSRNTVRGRIFNFNQLKWKWSAVILLLTILHDIFNFFARDEGEIAENAEHDQSTEETGKKVDETCQQRVPARQKSAQIKNIIESVCRIIGKRLGKTLQKISWVVVHQSSLHLPVEIIVERIVRRKSQENPEAGTQWEEDLRRGFRPHLAIQKPAPVRS